MKSAVETLSPTRAKLTVEVPFEELKPSLDAAYKKIAQQINVPGFRRGKVPPAVIDRQVGRGAVLDQAVNEVVPQKYVEALQENSLTAAGAAGDRGDQVRGQRGPRVHRRGRHPPEITLPDYDGVHAQVEDIELTDADVDEQVEALRERFATLIDVERAAADGDFVVLDLKADRTARSSRAPRSPACPTRSVAAACSTASTRRWSAWPPATRRPSAPSSSAVTWSARASTSRSASARSRSRSSPSSTTSSPRWPRSSTPSRELTDDVRERLGRGKRLEQAAAARDAVLEQLLEKVEIPLPETIVTDELNARRQSIEQQLAYAGITHGEVPRGRGPDPGGVRGRPRAPGPRRGRRPVHPRRDRQGRGVRHRPVRALRAPGARAPSSPVRTRRSSRTTCSSTTTSRTWCRRSCAARRWPGSSRRAVVTDASGNVVELKNLRPDGTIGEPEAEAADEAADEAAEDETEE